MIDLELTNSSNNGGAKNELTAFEKECFYILIDQWL